MILKFHTNENPYSPAECVQKSAIKGLKEINRYSELKYLNELKTLLGNYNNVPSDNIVVNHGSDLLIREFITVFSKDREIITINPSFFPISKYALQQARKLTKIQLSPPDFKFNQDFLLNESNKPRLIVVDNPNNPSGKILVDDNLVEKILQNENTLLLIDEAYYEFSGQTFAVLIKKYPNLAISRTMDKAFSLAGLRLGYLLIGNFLKDHFSDFPAFLSKPTLFAAIESLQNPEYITVNAKKIMSEKIRLKKN